MLTREGHSDAAVLGEHLGLGDLAEPLGFDSLFALEHHFTGYAMSPAPTQLLSYFAGRTQRIQLGTAITPTYPRHPLALAQQALTVADLAPGRLRLGVGPSHRHTMEGVYGLPMGEPLAHLREYVAVLRGLLWDGAADHRGRYFAVRASLPRAPRVPLPISALRAGAFRLAGEIADGALSWMCPAPYLLETALPALRAGAEAAGRPAPPLVAHVPVALSEDRAAVLAAGRARARGYAGSPFYARMFADAGFPLPGDGTVPDALVESLVVSGDEATVRARLGELLASGLDELLVMPVPVADAAGERARLARLLGQG
jgi:alkanesulfonate monooxygenase SsuD/methylene tetrahydromethanopterin reductase-like flavin-dependent oxidoreductase (luciferase family)